MPVVRFAVAICLCLCASLATAQLDQVQKVQFNQDREPVERLGRMTVTPCVGGMAGIYPCDKVDLLAFMPLSEIGGGSGNDIWGWTDPLTGREYALMGRSSGTSFVDITDPEDPVYLGNLPPHGLDSSWRDIKVYSNHAYIVSEASNHGVQVFDLTQLRNVTTPPVTFAETAHYGNIGSSHNIAINEDTGFAYVVGSSDCDSGPHFIDLSNPATPVFAGCHVETYYTHDTQCVVYAGPDPDHSGREICINSNETRVNVIDVTDHSASFLISETTYSQDGYTHQGWLTEDHRYFLFGDELDEQQFGHNTRTRVLDLLDLDAPVLIGAWDAATPAIDHNLYTHNGYAYQANYRAGLRILDLANVGAGTFTEVGFFDIYPSDDNASFNGAWSVYPYFDSGTVIVSGIEQGLFILRPVLGPDFGLDVDPTRVEVCDPGSDTAQIQLTDRNGYTGNVGFTTSGLPTGASASFSVDPVGVPGSTTMTIDAVGAAPGTYSFTVTGDDGTISHDKILTLQLASQSPGQPAATAPANGATDVTRTPMFSWTAATEGMTYTLEIATDPAFGSIVYSVQTSTTNHFLAGALSADTTHYWRVRAANPCGTGLDSATSSFTTLTVPDILLVDDDDNGPDVRADYIATLNALGRDFDVWDTDNTDDEPSASTLTPYSTVIWFTGDEFGGVAGPGAGGETALAAWLDESACLLISSQDYYYDRGLTGFMTSHLALESATSDVGQSSVTGLATYAGLGPYALSFPYTNYTDRMTADASGTESFSGSAGDAGVEKDTGVYRTSLWGFGLEALPSATDRENALSTFLTWCDALATLDGDSDGAVNESDCAPGDPANWSSPSPAYDLTVAKSSQDNLNWFAPLSPGATDVMYDVLRSGTPDGFPGSTCMDSGTDTVATDAGTPTAGEFWHYLIRVQNGCGTNLGDPPGRQAPTCP